jgi:hypothetical protein
MVVDGQVVVRGNTNTTPQSYSRVITHSASDSDSDQKAARPVSHKVRIPPTPLQLTL